MRIFWERLKSIFWRRASWKQRERSLDSELRFHLEMQFEENLRRGMTPREAHRQACVDLGGLEAVKEKYRDRSGFPALDSFANDFRFGLRMMRRSPGFTAVAVLTLALGIAGTTAVFSVVHAVILQPLRFSDSERLMVLLSSARDGKIFPPPEYLFVEWRDRARSFEDIAGAIPRRRVLNETSESRVVTTGDASFNFFRLLGAQPVFGRTFTKAEDTARPDPVAVLDAGFCQREFGGTRDALGRTIILDDKAYTVIGVLPAGFRFANFGAVDIWVPLAAKPSLQAEGRGAVVTVARLKPGVTQAAAQAEMDAVAKQIRRERPAYRASPALVRPLRDWITGDVRSPFLMLLGAVGFVLLIGCANIANLLLARSTARRREMAIRATLGAGRLRLVRQALTESLLLAAAGGSLGIALAFAAVRAVPAIRAIAIPRVDEIGVDRTVLLAALVATVVSGILCGIAPALQLGRRDLHASLDRGNEFRRRPASGARLRDILVAGELALALVLLCGAGLMANSLVRLLTVNLGFDLSQVFTVETSLPFGKYDSARRTRFHRQLAETIGGMPGVQGVSVADFAPLRAILSTYYIIANGGATRCEALGRHIDADYFSVVGIPLLAGRRLELADDTRKPVPVLINRTMSQALFDGGNPIGQQLRTQYRGHAVLEVAGVVGDARLLRATETAGPQLYLPLAYGGNQSIVVRSSTDAGRLTTAIRAAAHRLDPALPPVKIETMDARFGQETAQPRFYAALLAIFAAAGLGLAAIGVYGVMSYTVARRTHEFGVRMALGAQRRDVLRLVLTAGFRVTCIGAVAGLAGAISVTRLLSSLLFEVRPSDPITFACVVALLAVVAMVACYLAARRATAVDPNAALRCE